MGDQVVVQPRERRGGVVYQFDVVLTDRSVQVIPQLIQVERAGVFEQLDFLGLALAVGAADRAEDGGEVRGAGGVCEQAEMRKLS